ncbi:MAG: hypothetical protein ACC628_05480, partial [Pirellulaceae bacterium]
MARSTSFDYCGLMLVGALLLTAGLPERGQAADPTFVGALALAVENAGVKRLALNEETKGKLLELIDRREREAINIVLQIKDLPPEARAAKLAPFVQESERQGMALLTVEQRAILDQMRISAAGMRSLSESSVAKMLRLDPGQKDKIRELLALRDQQMTRGGEDDRRVTRERFERELAALLTQEQRVTWEKLAGMSGVAAPSTEAAATPATPAEPTPETSEGEQAERQPAELPDPNAPPSEKAATTTPEAETLEAAPESTPLAADAVEGAPDAEAAEGMEDAPETTATEAESVSRQPAQPTPGDDRIVSPAPAPSSIAAPNGKLVFNFENQPWAEVFYWFAEQADLSLQMDLPPPGTFNYRDSHSYSPAEALDLMNSVLITKGYTLVRHNRMLLVINVLDEIPPQLIDIVSLNELDERGDFELLRCLFHVIKLEPQEAADEIQHLIGPPPANAVALPKSGQLLVTETAAKLRLIRDVIEAVENPQSGRGEITEITLKYVGAEEF